MRTYQYYAPDDFEQLFALIEQNEGAEIKFLAGGSDLVPRISYERDQIPYKTKPTMVIISLAKLGLDVIEADQDTVSIGVMASLSKIEQDDVVNRSFPALSAAIREMADVNVRNSATIGGNIMNASPAGDTIPPLFIYDAILTLFGPEGERQVPVGEFFSGPGRTVAQANEVLTNVILKKGSGKSSFVKLGRRAAGTLSIVNAAAYVEIENGVCRAIRVAVGSVAPTVLQCDKTEATLLNETLDSDKIRESAKLVLDQISPISDVRASEWYRRRVAPVIVERAIKNAAGIALEGGEKL